ncbi:putative nuclease HARBI1 [Selaginella moellendorffii]|uniref:putative nuclease HARBI1 n=1 Tax=Selaginella moellendorffii TaxID=88036 RepID=UPI000D1D0415|nr:putative nuclease HARBI1 [Selaginella moellendorffii]|eukprot:XP_024515046.1 putative nuclease HARBI1 [Selaginella moellendorffii]
MAADFQQITKTRLPNVAGAIDCTHFEIIRPVGPDGSVHDMRVFRNSRLCHKIQARELLTVPREFAFDEWIEPYLVGDKGYQLQQHLMIPHLGSRLTVTKAEYNQQHHLARIVIKQAFGLLKMKFKCLDQKQRIKPKYLPNIIKSCCILHNFLIDVGETNINAEIKAWEKHIQALKEVEIFEDYGDPIVAEGEPQENLHGPEDA